MSSWDEYPLAGRLRVEEPVGVFRLLEREAVGEKALEREREPLGDDVDRDHARAHRPPEHRGGEADGALAEDREGVAPRDVEALQRAVGGAGPARDRGALLEAERVGQGHERARRHLHVRRVPAGTRHAVDDGCARTELWPADAAGLAPPPPLVIVVHYTRAGPRL